MSTERQIRAAIFDMDGLLIDSEPLWEQSEHEILGALGVDFTRRHELPDTRGDLNADFRTQIYVRAQRETTGNRCRHDGFRARDGRNDAFQYAILKYLLVQLAAAGF